MPMIDVYAAAGMFSDASQLAKDLAAALMAVEGVPNIPMFGKNTAAFVHELPPLRRLHRDARRPGTVRFRGGARYRQPGVAG
jgi:hypothetical protein